MKTCTYNDCTKKHHARGLCLGHYKQTRRGLPLAPLRVEKGELDETQVAEIKAAVEAGESHRAVGERAGISHTAVYRIANGLTYKGL